MASDAGQAPLKLPVPLAHAALLIWSVLPLFVTVPASINVVVTATLCVFVGCWRSVKPLPPVDTLTNKDALRFPLIGGAVLCGLFALFKFLPKELVNRVLSLYFVALGALACTATVAPFVARLLPRSLQGKAWEVKQLTIPLVLTEPTDWAVKYPEALSGAAAAGFCIWYHLRRHWLANNILGLAFSIQGIEHLSLGAVQTGIILLSGLFAYDCFFVFATPIMVSVATSLEAPIKLLFPRVLEEGSTRAPFSMLGLGDIVIPGIFVALILRYDATVRKYASTYFWSAFVSYAVGLGITIGVMNWFGAAQPALLYIVPCVIGGPCAHSCLRGELQQVWSHTEARPAGERDGAAETVQPSQGPNKVEKKLS